MRGVAGLLAARVRRVGGLGVAQQLRQRAGQHAVAAVLPGLPGVLGGLAQMLFFQARAESLISRYHFARLAAPRHPSLFDPDGARAETLDQHRVVRDEEHRLARFAKILHPVERFALKVDVADRQGFIHDQNVRINVDCRGKGQTHQHSGRIGLH